jgi:protein-tyrosine phosphatase
MVANKHPIPDSYWVEPDRLLAGEYPGSKDERKARHKIRQLLEAGITYFLDLTEAGEYDLRSYKPLLLAEAELAGCTVEYRRMPIRDRDTPTVTKMRTILATLEAALQAQQVVYIHCLGGIGRTGTVVGCYLVQQGMDGQAALDRIAQLRRGTPDGRRASPETGAQCQMVLGWVK